MTCTDPHPRACPHHSGNLEEPVYLVRVEGGCDAVYLCTACQRTWEFAWGCG
jgi:hypothetical protein